MPSNGSWDDSTSKDSSSSSELTNHSGSVSKVVMVVESNGGNGSPSVTSYKPLSLLDLLYALLSIFLTCYPKLAARDDIAYLCAVVVTVLIIFSSFVECTL